MVACGLPFVLSVIVNVSGPFTHENLSIFLLHRPDLVDGARYSSLQEGFEGDYVDHAPLNR